MKKYNFIYKVTNIINGKFYIGKHSTNNLDDGYMGSGLYISRAKKKYGSEFNKIFKREILEDCDSLDILNEQEKYYIDIDDILCMNIAKGGTGGDTYTNNPNLDKIKNKFRGHTHSKETKEKMARSRTGHKNGMYGKNHNKSVKDKISKANKINSKGINNPMYGTSYKWINNNGNLKRVKLPEINNYLQMGWKVGRK